MEYDDEINRKYGRSFREDPKFNNILSDTSIDDKVRITEIHKSINSLSGQLEKSQSNAHKQIKSISSSVASTAKQQQKIVQQFKMKELSSSRQVKAVEKSVQQILGKLGYAINALGVTSKKILIDTARTAKDTLREYGQAINSDFGVNKQNVVAMAIAKASPIFGYFAGKFMETSVFKNFANLIKTKLSMAVTFVGNKMRDLWGRTKEGVSRWKNKRKEDKGEEPLPKLQKGGYIKKGGAVEVHAAEVVTPVNKLLKTISKAFTEAISPLDLKLGKIASYLNWKLFMGAAAGAYGIYKWWRRNKYSPWLSKQKDPQRKLAEDFANYYTMSLEKFDALVAALSPKNWTKTQLAANEAIEKGKRRIFGSQQGELFKTSKKEQAIAFFTSLWASMKDEAKNTPNTYRESISKYKNKFTGYRNKLLGPKETQQGLLPGMEPEETRLSSAYNKSKDTVSKGYKNTRSFIHNRITGVSGSGLLGAAAFIAKTPYYVLIKPMLMVGKGLAKLTFALVKLPFKILTKAISLSIRTTLLLMRGISKLTKGIWNLTKWTIGIPFRALFGSVKLLTRAATSVPKAFLSMATAGIGKATSFIKGGGVSGAFGRLFSSKEDKTGVEEKSGAAAIAEIHKKEKKKTGVEGELQKIRHSVELFHGSVSKTWVEKKKKDSSVSKSWKSMLGEFKKSKETLQKQWKTLRDSYSTLKEERAELKQIKKATKGTESNLGTMNFFMKKQLGRIGTWLMLGFGFIKQLFGSITGWLSKIPQLIIGSKIGKGIGGLFKKGGMLTAGKFAKFAKFGGGILGAASMGMDIWEGVGKSNEWGASKTASGIGGALGGTSSGVSGALGGMAKGAAIGMMFGPIGAGIGALAGGLLGFVGGKNIAKGLDWIWDKVKPLVNSITDVLMFPFKILMDLKDRFMKWLDDPTKTMIDRVKDIAESIVNIVSFPQRLMIGLMSSMGKTIWDRIPNVVKGILPKWLVTGVTSLLSGSEKLSKGFEGNFGGGSAVESTTGALKKVSSLAGGVVSGAAESVANVGGAAVQAVSETKAGKAVIETGKQVGTVVSEKATTAIESAKSMVGGVKNVYDAIVAGLGGGKNAISKAITWASPIWSALKKFGLTSVNQISAFLGQIMHESGGLKWLTELGKPEYFNKYDPQFNPRKAKDLGNTQPGDGYKYRGRGLLQITGRSNYEAAERGTGLPLVANPDLAAKPENAALVSAFWWKNNKAVQAAAERGDFQKVSRIVNMGRDKGIAAKGEAERLLKTNSVMNAIQNMSQTEVSEMYPNKTQLPTENASTVSSPVEEPTLTKKAVAKIQATGEIAKSELTNANIDKLKDNALDLFDQTSKNTILMINNMTSIVSSSMSNLSNSIGGAANKVSGQASDILERLLSGNV